MGDKDLDSCKSFWKGKQQWKKKVGEGNMGIMRLWNKKLNLVS